MNMWVLFLLWQAAPMIFACKWMFLGNSKTISENIVLLSWEWIVNVNTTNVCLFLHIVFHLTVFYLAFLVYFWFYCQKCLWSCSCFLWYKDDQNQAQIFLQFVSIPALEYICFDSECATSLVLLTLMNSNDAQVSLSFASCMLIQWKEEFDYYLILCYYFTTCYAACSSSFD